MPLSVIQIFVMMIGELNYETNFLKPNLDNKLPFTFLTYVLFIEFALLMPILLVNLLVSRPQYQYPIDSCTQDRITARYAYRKSELDRSLQVTRT